ncbi:alpha/beta hydrolase [Mesorhizobium sp. LHD-90]|uniref:alpha/beta fold hydrolase n=1 Tax=Mesorhizobium sp. LHD-90 TaxID=3071414 RepID=UPI0027DEFD22|nr:alpha/beta hydrolase [Mesorhizobium sp. LHD-90]MDQ6437791.1 alpha/beta hydrolase [Mesorhizobium sp. LHD-90]
MNLLSAAVICLLALALVLIGVSRIGAWLIERRNPPVGAFAEIGGARIHHVHVPAPPGADLPPVVFIHGASANLNDQMAPLRPLLEGRAELLFFDRPGHGWSERGGGNDTPQGQAKTLADLMGRLGIGKAIVVGHSFGGATAAALALGHPDKVAGLVFVSAATHPWPGGRTSWYYELAAWPAVGRLFSETLAYPGGMLQMARATDCVFAPNPTPDDYLNRASIPLVLRPAAFHANSIDVQGLYAFAEANAPRYRDIETPTVVISGDRDTVVYEEIHSLGLARDILGAELVWIKNLGHKPDWIAPDLVVDAIAKVAGKDVDLDAAARALEARIAGDRHGEGICIDEKPAEAELAPL